jgi:hypothetical protein
LRTIFQGGGEGTKFLFLANRPQTKPTPQTPVKKHSQNRNKKGNRPKDIRKRCARSNHVPKYPTTNIGVLRSLLADGPKLTGDQSKKQI